MKFVADAMLGRLAKRLRLRGYDVLYDPTWDDNEIIRRSLADGRTILTRDTRLAGRPVAGKHILISCDRPEEQEAQVQAEFPQAGQEPLTRCSVCNGTLAHAEKSEVRDLVPDHVAAHHAVFLQCGNCGKVYWEGTHARRMRGK